MFALFGVYHMSQPREISGSYEGDLQNKEHDELRNQESFDVRDYLLNKDVDEQQFITKLEDESLRVGEPDKLAQYWERQENATDCGIASQRNLLKAYDIKVDTEEIRQLGEKMQAYVRDGGTFSDRVGFAFERYGLGRNYYEGRVDLEGMTDPYEAIEAEQRLISELEQKHAVICCVDAPVLWDPDRDNLINNLNQSVDVGGHQLWITGARYDKYGIIDTIYCNDTGLRRDGANRCFEGSVFREAWARRGYRMAATQKPMEV
jgi:hypothetical protein